MVAAANQGQLVDAVKNAQRSSTELKEAWHHYCDSCGGGVRDPARQSAAFLQSFLAAAASPRAVMVPGRAPALAAAPFAQRGAAADTLLAQQVKNHQRSSPEARENWHNYCDEQGGGVRDPSRHNAAFLRAYLQYVGVEPVAQDTGTQAKLVERVKAVQRSSEMCRDAWHALCDGQGGIRDPAKHTAEVLEGFLASYETAVPVPAARPPPQGPPSMAMQPAPTGMSTEHAELVAGVKCLQKSSTEMREAWHAFCDNKGPGIRDPSRHAPEFLREFVTLSAQGAEAVLAAVSTGENAGEAGYDPAPWPKRARLA